MANKYKALQKQAIRERRRQKMCNLKAAYGTKEAAFQKGQSLYNCPYCHQWHRSGATEKFIAGIVNRNKRKEFLVKAG